MEALKHIVNVSRHCLKLMIFNVGGIIVELENLLLKNGDIATIREAQGSDANKIIEYVNIISGESDFLTFGLGEFIMTTEQEEEFLEKTSRQNNAIYIIAEIEERILDNNVKLFEGFL